MAALLEAMLDYFASAIPSGSEGRTAITIWFAAATVTLMIAAAYFLTR